MIHQQRITPLNRLETPPGQYVLYWMQAAQRAECNHALEHAIEKANELKVPVVVAFALTADFPEA
ncbi:MAG: deoxyribodipyrimidine photo-lyase, partial [Planctomycetota bacterium]